MTDPSKQLCDQQQLGRRWKQQKCGRYCWTYGVRGRWGNTSTYISYSCLDVKKCGKYEKHSKEIWDSREMSVLSCPFQSLDYVKNYAEATSQWEGFPIRVGICPQHPFYHQHLGECASSKHLGGLQRIRFCRRHQHSCRGSRGAGSSWHHGVVLQVWYCRHHYIN